MRAQSIVHCCGPFAFAQLADGSELAMVMQCPHLPTNVSQVGLPEAARVKRYIPFSDGRRDCVGQALGRLNYTSTLARLLGNFHFELAPEVLPSNSCCPISAACLDHAQITLRAC